MTMTCLSALCYFQETLLRCAWLVLLLIDRYLLPVIVCATQYRRTKCARATYNSCSARYVTALCLTMVPIPTACPPCFDVFVPLLELLRMAGTQLCRTEPHRIAVHCCCNSFLALCALCCLFWTLIAHVPDTGARGSTALLIA